MELWPASWCLGHGSLWRSLLAPPGLRGPWWSVWPLLVLPPLWPSLFFLLLEWRVGRSRQPMQGRGGEPDRPWGLAKTWEGNEVLGSLDPWRPRQTLPKCSWLTLQSPTLCWQSFLSEACNWKTSCPLSLPFAYFSPLWGRKEEKEPKKAKKETVTAPIPQISIIWGMRRWVREKPRG